VESKNPIYLKLTDKERSTALQRNYMCPEYDTCLAAAAHANADLDCRQCAWRDLQKDPFLISDAEVHGCHALLCAIFMGGRP
jgi:hypothetical protein